jgi:hypothetical protein
VGNIVNYKESEEMDSREEAYLKFIEKGGSVNRRDPMDDVRSPNNLFKELPAQQNIIVVSELEKKESVEGSVHHMQADIISVLSGKSLGSFNRYAKHNKLQKKFGMSAVKEVKPHFKDD